MIRYSNEIIPRPFGLRNLGATCYFNAVFQSMLSLSSVIETVGQIRMSPEFAFMPAARQRLFDIYESAAREGGENSAAAAWQLVYEAAQLRADRTKLTGGQQCAGEGLDLLLDLFGPQIEYLFKHRFMRSIHCEKCNKVVSRKREEYTTFEVEPHLQSAGKEYKLEEYMGNLDGAVEGFKCPECGDVADKKIHTTVTMVPEVLAVLAKKYEAGAAPGERAHKINVLTPFPPALSFNGVEDGKKAVFRYEAVAQIEHSGGTEGGHYWAFCRRNGSKWYRLDDGYVQPIEGGFAPTENTYIVMYHVM